MQFDERYQKLRKKLDTLRYMQTLHPDSVELVDRILKDLIRVKTEFEAEKEKQQQQPSLYMKSDNNGTTEELSKSYQIDLLNEQNHELKQEIYALKQNLGNNTNDGRVNKLQSTLNDLKKNYEIKIDELNSRILNLSSENAEIRVTNSKLAEEKQKIKTMNIEKEIQLESSNKELIQLLERKNKEIKDFEENASKLRIKISSLEGLLDDARMESAAKDQEEKVNLSKTVEILRQEHSEACSKIDFLKVSLEESIKERDELKRNNKKLMIRVSELEEKEASLERSSVIHNTTTEKLSQIQSDTNELLQKKIEECDELKERAEADAEEIDKLRIKIKDLTNKNKAITDNLATVQDEINVVSVKYTQKVKELKEIESQKTALERRLREKEVELEELSNNNYNYGRHEESSMNNSNLQTHVLEKEISLLKQELNIAKDHEHKITGDKEKLSIECKRLQHIISEGNKQVELLQTQKEHFAKESADLRKQLENGYGSDTLLKQEQLRLNSKIEAQEVFIEELKAAIKSEQLQTRHLHQELLSSQSEREKERTKNSSMHEDNKQLVLQLKEVESKRKELMDQVKLFKERSSVNEGTSMEAKKIIAELETKIKQLESQLQQKTGAVIALDREKDEIQNILDEKTELAASLQSKIKEMESVSQSYNRGLNEKEYSLQSLTTQISKMEYERERLLKECDKCQEECQNYAEKASKSESLMREIENEMKIMAFSHKELQNELERMKGRYNELEKKLKAKQKDYDEEKEKRSANQILNKELSEQIQLDRGEITRLDALVNELEKENNNMFYHLENRDREVEELKRVIDDCHRQDMLHVQEITHYEKRLEQMGNEMENLFREREDLVREKASLRAENSWKTESNATITWKAALEDRLHSLQNDYELKKRECEEMRTRIREFERIISEERMKVYTLEQRLNGSIRNHNNTSNSEQFFNSSKHHSVIQHYHLENSNDNYREHNNSNSTPIKNITDSRLDSENWDSCNRGDSSSLLIMESSIVVPNQSHQQYASKDQSIVNDGESVASKKRIEKMQELEKAYATTVIEQAKFKFKKDREISAGS